jgi:hypothetical protein
MKIIPATPGLSGSSGFSLSKVLTNARLCKFGNSKSVLFNILRSLSNFNNRIAPTSSFPLALILAFTEARIYNSPDMSSSAFVMPVNLLPSSVLGFTFSRISTLRV